MTEALPLQAPFSRPSHPRFARPILVGLALAAAAQQAAAQVAPNLEWHSITSAHFHVHYSTGMEATARTTLSLAESAWSALALELKPPRGRIDLVLADNVDFSNGYANTFPTNRIVIYTVPPHDVPMLRATNDWLYNIVVHELTHIFHLDRVGGIWTAARWVFGRNPSMMPQLYTPAWLREGLAVYYESRLTDGGRLRSAEEHMIVRAAAEQGRLPALGQMSLATSRPPEGHTPYVFGAQLVEYLAERAGPARMDEFLGSISASIIPYTSSWSASRKLGISFGDALDQLSDSVLRAYGAGAEPVEGWRPLTREGRTAWHPRWLAQDTLVYARSDGRSSAGLYRLSIDGKSERVARRNGVSINAPRPDGAIVFAQPEYLDPYTVRSDLYVREPGGREIRLTRGARLSSPDVRSDGEIVAVQIGQGSTTIVRVSADGSSITPLVAADSGSYWADPRWSPDGSEVAAVRREQSGLSSLVIVDADRRVTEVLRGNLVIATPEWIDANTLLYHREGDRPQLAVARRGGGLTQNGNVSTGSTGVLQPAIAVRGAAAPVLAAVEYKFRGYRIGVAPLSITAASGGLLPTVDLGGPGAPAVPAATVGAGNVDPGLQDLSALEPRRYRAWRFMIPRYWVPLGARAEDDHLLVGAATTASDVVDRHAYAAQVLLNTGNGFLEGSFNYFYAGFGMPVVRLGLDQSSGYTPLVNSSTRQRVGFLREQSRIAALSLGVSRPGYRRAASFSLGAELERVTFDTQPRDLIEALTSFDASPREYVAAVAGFGWANTRRPSLSISPEDGISFSVTARERWRRGSGGAGRPPSLTVTTSLRGFKSLDLPGFAHHVLAARVSAGVANSHATSRFSVGGKSGSRLEVFPGYTIGDSPRSFPVRGFDSGTLTGLRALAGSLEYRAPLAMPAHGIGMVPLFFDKISFSLFGDAGAAWCPRSFSALPLCDDIPSSASASWIASVGAELNFDTALQYDVPYRFRVGFANAVRTPPGHTAPKGEFYLTLGFPF
jgi:hypothetical protein